MKKGSPEWKPPRGGNLYDHRCVTVLHHVHQALRAHALFKRDVDYIVKGGKVIIVDEFTGRLMPGRRYSEGLHQALEAKEGVRIENENQTLASITFQNYFRMYEKLAGMTGTAETEAAEFSKIYKLDVVVIPTHRKMIRIDNPDCIYRTEREKFRAVVKEIKELHRMGRPVLVGTINIEKSEKLSEMLKREGVPHQVLNAKHHEKEAEIVAKAGQYGGGHHFHQHGGPRNGHCAGTGRRRAGRSAHHRYRTPRGPANRQSVARPIRSAGGPRFFQVFSLSRGRFNADLCGGTHCRPHAAHRDGGG